MTQTDLADRLGVTRQTIIAIELGRYMVQHCLARGYEGTAVCREKSAHKLDDFKDRITVIPGRTNDREVIEAAVAGCDGVLTILVPWGVEHYSSSTGRLHMGPSVAQPIVIGLPVSPETR